MTNFILTWTDEPKVTKQPQSHIFRAVSLQQLFWKKERQLHQRLAFTNIFLFISQQRVSLRMREKKFLAGQTLFKNNTEFF